MQTNSRGRLILRPRTAWERCDVAKTTSNKNFVLHDESDLFIPGTSMRRPRRKKLGPRITIYFEDEVNAKPIGRRPGREAMTPKSESRRLVEASHDSRQPLHLYGEAVCCLTVRAIGEGDQLRVANPRCRIQMRRRIRRANQFGRYSHRVNGRLP